MRARGPERITRPDGRRTRPAKLLFLFHSVLIGLVMALIHLIYTSTLVQGGPEVLGDILHTAQHINQLRGITGMLLHANGSVLQVLEGEEAEVSTTFQSIERDTRHRDVFVLSRQSIAERQFGAWTMGLRNLTATELRESPSAGQVFDANKHEIATRVQPGAALALLVFFAQGVEVPD